MRFRASRTSVSPASATTPSEAVDDAAAATEAEAHARQSRRLRLLVRGHSTGDGRSVDDTISRGQSLAAAEMRPEAVVDAAERLLTLVYSGDSANDTTVNAFVKLLYLSKV